MVNATYCACHVFYQNLCDFSDDAGDAAPVFLRISCNVIPTVKIMITSLYDRIAVCIRVVGGVMAKVDHNTQFVSV